MKLTHISEKTTKTSMLRQEKANAPIDKLTLKKNTTNGPEQKTPKKDPEVVEELRAQWKQMWNERFDDKRKAEVISVNDYDTLKIERGTVIHATKDFKVLEFRELLDQHKIENPERYIQPDASAGGWNRFIKTKISNSKTSRKNLELNCTAKKTGPHVEKCSRGWLHLT